MQHRKLGKNGPEVSAIGLGCMGMSEFYGNGDDKESTRVIHEAIDRGIDFFDTADAYGIGRNEELVGKAIRGKRQKLIVATKFGNVRTSDGNWVEISGKPDYIRKACDASLRRLGIETIDLYYQHRVDTTVPIEETVGAMAELVKQGKVRYLGLSEAGVQTIRRANAVHPIAALQTEYSLWSRDVEHEILPACREMGIGFVAYSPLGRGFLTGKIRSLGDLPENDFRRNAPRFQPENFRKNHRLVEMLESISGRKKCTPAQLALAWCLAQGTDIVPIPGTKRMKFLSENIGALDVPLTHDDLLALDEAFPSGAAAGERYAPAGMERVGR